MSGHSKWSTIKRKKGAADAKRGKLFTRLGNAITIAAKQGGGDPDMNAALATEIDRAKDANMPNDTIERAIKRGTGELGGEVVEEMMYEGYGPGGVAILVECATDNRNRTYADVKTAFSKNGGNVADSGAVAYLFDRKGVINVDKSGDADADQLGIIDAGAEDVFDDGDIWVVHTDPKELHAVRDKLKETGFNTKDAKLAFIPKNTMVIEDEKVSDKVINLMEALDDLDDVVETHTNFDIADEDSGN